MLMILARLVRSESFWAVAKVRSPHTGPGIRYIIAPQSTRLRHTPERAMGAQIHRSAEENPHLAGPEPRPGPPGGRRSAFGRDELVGNGANLARLAARGTG